MRAVMAAAAAREVMYRNRFNPDTYLVKYVNK
jgi:hypothetical protein